MKYLLLLLLLTTSSYAYTAKKANEISTKQATIIKQYKEAAETSLLKDDRKKILKAIKRAAKAGVFVVYLSCDRVYNKNGSYFRDMGYKIQDVMGVCSISWE